MTTENYSIEPLPSRELAQQWSKEWWGQRDESPIGELLFVATKAAQWGFNQRSAVNEAELQKARDEELEACCEWLVGNDWFTPDGECIKSLRAARRPKSQAEQAIAELDGIATCFRAGFGGGLKCGNIRAALERLRELEDGNA